MQNSPISTHLNVLENGKLLAVEECNSATVGLVEIGLHRLGDILLHLHGTNRLVEAISAHLIPPTFGVPFFALPSLTPLLFPRRPHYPEAPFNAHNVTAFVVLSLQLLYSFPIYANCFSKKLGIETTKDVFG